MWTRHLLVASAALALASPAFAQTPPMSPSAPDTRGASPPSRGSDDTAAPSSRATGTASTKFLTLQKDGEQISSDLVGMSVVNNAGENVGKISNLIIDKDNRVSGAVLSVGGFLGLGAKSVAVPWDALKIEKRDNRHVAAIAMSNAEIVNAPDFKTQAQVKAEAEAPRRAPGAPASPMTAPRSSQ
ncbi:MAG TPA: PRC-barrel domain-containing protein [Alphaproteobacteria bacterium]